MRTTIDIHDPLLERAKRFASDRGKRLADVVNDALIEKLGREEQPSSANPPFRMLTFGEGGVQPGVDISNSGDLQDIMDEEFRDPETGKLDVTKLR